MDKKNPGQKTGGVVNVRPTIKDRKPPGTTNTEERYRRVIPVMLCRTRSLGSPCPAAFWLRSLPHFTP
jgi:hypothetical protein